jgi:hypothetical protein
MLSYRMRRRTCFAVAPMARSIASSRVRSGLDRNRLLVIPNSEITMLMASSA